MKKQPVYWKMRNGKSISIDDMDLNHLRNVLKMIVRNSQKKHIKSTNTLTDCQELEKGLHNPTLFNDEESRNIW